MHLLGRCWTQALRLRRASSGRPLQISQERKRSAWEYVLPDGCSKEKRARSSSLLWKKLLRNRFRAVGISGLEAQVHPLNEHMEEDTICQGLTTQKKAARSSLTALSSGLPLVLLLQSAVGPISPSHPKY